MEEAIAIINALAVLIPAAAGLYTKLAAQVPGTASLQDLLTQADANWNKVDQTAQAQLHPPKS